MEGKIPEDMMRITLENFQVGDTSLSRDHLVKFAFTATRVLKKLGIHTYTDGIFLYAFPNTDIEELRFGLECAMKEYLEGIGLTIEEHADG